MILVFGAKDGLEHIHQFLELREFCFHVSMTNEDLGSSGGSIGDTPGSNIEVPGFWFLVRLV